MEDKDDIFWILLTMAIGLGAHALLIIGSIFHIGLVGFATEVAIYIYLFLLAFAVAQRMVPFFSHSMVEKNTSLLKTLFILLVLHVVIEGFIVNGSFLFDIAIGGLLIKEIKRWKLPLFSPNPLLLILHISLYWAAVAFILGGLSNFMTLVLGTPFLALDVHILVLGFVFTILIGFGTRVTIGHSGNMMQSDNWVKGLFIWTQVVVLVRLLVSLVAAVGWDFMVLFDISATVWFIMFIAWGIRFFAVLIQGKKLTN